MGVLVAALLLAAAAWALFGWEGPGATDRPGTATLAPARPRGPDPTGAGPGAELSSDGSSARVEAGGGEEAAAPPPTEEEAALRGLVLDAKGRPAVGASVSLVAVVPVELLARCGAQWLPGTSFGRLLRTTETDAGGRFSFAQVPRLPDESPYRGFRIAAITLDPPAFGAIGPIDVPPSGRREPVEVRLRPAFALEGRIETEEGVPVAGARVFAGDVYTPIEARSDATGRFRIVPAPPSRFWVWFHHPDFVYHEVAQVDAVTGPPGEPVRLVARPAGEIVVRVRDARGRPVAGALVVARSIRPPSSEYWTSGPEGVFVPERTVVFTDERGGAIVRPAGLHWVTLRASAPGLGEVEHSKRPDDPPHWDAVLEEGLALEGVVTRPDGTPAAGAELTVLQLVRGAGAAAAKEVLRTTRRLASFRAGDDGSFRYALGSKDVVWSGPLYLRAQGDDGAIAWRGPLGYTFFDNPRPLAVRLGDGRRVEVLVRDAVDGPVAGARVTAELAFAWDRSDLDEEDEPTFLPFERRTAGGDGRALFESLPAMPVRFALHAEGFAATRSAVVDLREDEPDGPVVLVVRREARLVVRVHDEQGEPTSGLPVLVFPEGGDRLVAETGDDGTATFAGLPAGEAQVRLLPPWERPNLGNYSYLHREADFEEGPSRALVRLEPGRETVVERTIALPPMGRLSGRVIFLEQLAGRAIVTHWEDERHGLTFWRGAKPDDQGRFDLGAVPAGRHRIEAGPVVFEVEVPPGGERDVLLDVPLGSVRGTVRVSAAGEHGKMQVSLRRRDETSGEWRWGRQVDVGEDGGFTVPALPVGRWRALAWGQGLCSDPEADAVEFDVEPDRPAEIEVPARTGGWLRVEVAGWTGAERLLVVLAWDDAERPMRPRSEGTVYATWLSLDGVEAGPAEVRLEAYGKDGESAVLAREAIDVPPEEQRCGRNLKVRFRLDG